MFSRIQLDARTDEIARRFSVETRGTVIQQSGEMISGFDHLPHPIITSREPTFLSTDYHWGLVPPDWKKSPAMIWDRTISAKLEYLEKRYSWRNVISNRCLVPVTSYYEFRWNDVKGRSKTRFKITSRENALFALAGLFSHWDFRGTTLKTFAICTTDANLAMQFVHNKDAAKNYSRMPVMLNPGDEGRWLDPANQPFEFAYPNYHPDLIAHPEAEGSQLGLF